ncbi:toxin-antitoxin system YwqK family antitoxin [Paenalcaligenes sp. Me131]|uniref:toxin-antitoxin system YwqK family antitoxin n=1 Tax=Paenalcaligenes sp. Me131 TaxID=3392636 RepID=UPI003D29D791
MKFHYSLPILVLSLLVGCAAPKPKLAVNLGPFPDFQLEELQDSEDGEFLAHYPNGQIKQHSWVRGDCLDQQLNTYYENGKPKMVIPIDNCKANGVVKGYYPNGNLEYELSVVNGIPHGSFRQYHDSDSNLLSMRAQLKNGAFDGIVEELDDYGDAVKRGAVIDGTIVPFTHANQ